MLNKIDKIVLWVLVVFGIVIGVFAVIASTLGFGWCGFVVSALPISSVSWLACRATLDD